MKPAYPKFVVAILFIASLCSTGWSQDKMPVSKLTPLAFLIGHWQGNFPMPVNGQTMVVEETFAWTANHQGIRFDSTRVLGEKRQPYLSGMYFWDPEKSRFMITYTDEQGALTTGYVENKNGVYQHELRKVTPSGAVVLVRTKLSHPDDNTFVRETDLKSQDDWQKLVTVHYVRSGAS